MSHHLPHGNSYVSISIWVNSALVIVHQGSAVASPGILWECERKSKRGLIGNRAVIMFTLRPSPKNKTTTLYVFMYANNLQNYYITSCLGANDFLSVKTSHPTHPLYYY